MIVLIALILLAHSQTVYYVSQNGKDSASCGVENNPCVTINQVLNNYPGVSCTIKIDTGTYVTNDIVLQRDAHVVFQGVGNPIISAVWKTFSGSFVANSESSGFEFRDLTINLIGDGGGNFALLNATANVGGFYNVILIYSGFTTGQFVHLNGGSIVLNNVTMNGVTSDEYFIYDFSDNDDTNITITGSTFSNLTYKQYGALIAFQAYGSALVLINTSAFTNITTSYVFIGFWAEDDNQKISVTNNIFTNLATNIPSVYIENDYQCVIVVDNTSWINASSDFVAGALEAVGSDNNFDHTITLSNLKFTDCYGPYAGALACVYNSLNLSNSVFANNTSNFEGHDVTQILNKYSSDFKYIITNSTSSSVLPKAVVWNSDTNEATDISEQLPDHASSLSSLSDLIMPLSIVEKAADDDKDSTLRVAHVSRSEITAKLRDGVQRKKRE